MAALPSLRQLRYLLALAEHLNFTRAAEASFVSQSTLSTGLKELEGTLGVQLVERDKQSVALTAVGKDVVTRARQVLAAAEDLSDFASDASRPMQGRLRLGVIPTIAPFVLPAVMPLLREKFPMLELGLREDLTAHLLERLRNRQLDFALIALPYDTPDLRVLPLYKDRFWLVGREKDPGDPRTCHPAGQRVDGTSATARRGTLPARPCSSSLPGNRSGQCGRDRSHQSPHTGTNGHFGNGCCVVT